MNTKFFLLLYCAIFVIACENRENKTARANQIKSASNQNYKIEGNQNSANVSANTSNNSSNENLNAKANIETSAEDDEAKFAWTATAITEKKNQVKGVAVLKEVRAGEHAGFDRVVFEFEGAELPSYHIEYIDKPARACGSGEIVRLKGEGRLEIRFTPAAAHTEEGKPTVKNRRQSPNFKIFKEMKSTCDFEAEVEWVLGVASPNKYRILELKNPTRLAVDIKH